MFSYGGAFLDTDPYPTTNLCTSPPPVTANVCINDNSAQHQIKSEVINFATAHGLTMDATHIFFVFFPDGFTTCATNSSTACAYTQYCAYHHFAAGSPTDPLYANITFYATSSGLSCRYSTQFTNARPATQRRTRR